MTMMFKVAQSAQKRGCCQNGHQLLKLLIEGITFVDSILNSLPDPCDSYATFGNRSLQL